METSQIKILHIDSNHPLMIESLNAAGFTNHTNFKGSLEEILAILPEYNGIVIRSRVAVNRRFIDAAKKLQFIARVGAGLESIDIEYAESKGIKLFAAPEGNRNAVAEHALGMLLSVMNNLNQADREVRNGQWNRESNRGHELDGKTVGIVGYGNTGKSFAKKLRGFDVNVLCYDIVENLGNENARQVSLDEIFRNADVLSLHVPSTPLTTAMVNTNFINSFSKPFWLINTSRGKNVVTADLVEGLKSGKIIGAGLDVMEYEKVSFEQLAADDLPEPLRYLIEAKNVLLTPHIAGWTFESHEKLARVIVGKIIDFYRNN
ncbi:MAG: hydroxyacid dehydrogenase [Flavobacterium sp.]|nr:MAG: hydroxyacid dehydrogenase [Flavobacterium sp.]